MELEEVRDCVDCGEFSNVIEVGDWEVGIIGEAELEEGVTLVLAGTPREKGQETPKNGQKLLEAYTLFLTWKINSLR